MKQRSIAVGVLLVGMLLVAAQCPFLPSTPPPLPEPGVVLFFDDFEDGIDAGWSGTEGWTASDGMLRRYYTGDDVGLIYVSAGATWRNYIVEVTLDSRSDDVCVLLRCQADLESYVQLRGNHYAIWWQVLDEGEIVAESEPLRPGFAAGRQDVRIAADGEEYSLAINGVRRSTFTDDHFEKGAPALNQFGAYLSTKNSATFDDVRVTELK